MIGKTISHYKILEKLGAGGMGEVYLAEDLKLERKVAIKFLPQHLTKDKDNIERFEREAKATAAINHPNIITIYDVMQTDGQVCIVMEYVDGKSLREVINEYELGLNKIIDIASQISEGLLQAHNAGIVHRDIKPENIIVGKDARIRILDFGLAKLKGVSKLTKETSTLGTIHYMSPEQYDRVITDVFAIQDEITMAIVRALKIELLSGENQAVKKKYTENLEAYHLYLKGRHYWNKMNPEAFWKAIDHFQRAIELDPGYALAYAGLADSYAGLGDAGLSAISPLESFSTAKAAVRKALEIDEALAEAHVSLGHLKMHDFDWSGAEQEFKRAINLNPNYAPTYHTAGFNFALMEKHEEAIKTLKKALNLDPVSLGIITDLGVIYYFARQYDKAIQQYQKALEFDPAFIRAYVTLGSAYGQKGMYEQAIEMIQKAIDLSGDRSKIAVLGRVLALADNKVEALKIIDELNKLSEQRYISPYCIALIYASMDEKDLAMEYLHKAYTEHVSELIYLRVDPYLDKLRSDPRFKDLLKKVCLGK